MSLANYIILCDGRINLASAKSGFEMIQIASRTATELVKYYGDKLTYADAKSISDLQHKMMEVVEAKPVTHSAGELVDEMFARLEAREGKIRS